MTNPIGISPSVMINRIAVDEGASLNTHLAQVAVLRAHMANEQAELIEKEKPQAEILANPVNGAEVDLLV